MNMVRKGDRGFTLIELLIVVMILGVLAAVVIPNVGRFVGKGKTEAAATELANLQTAVTSLMTDNLLTALPNPVGAATSNMTTFPDSTSAVGVGKLVDPTGTAYAVGDKNGYILFGHDITADAAQTGLVNYVATNATKGTYTVTADGTVTQVTTGY